MKQLYKKIIIITTITLQTLHMHGSNKELFEAIEKNKISTITKLLKNKNININEKNEYGETPLIFAIGNENIDAAKILLKDDRIEVDEADGEGSTALHYAAESMPEIIANLMDKGADPNKKATYNATPLMVAAQTKSYGAFEKLIQYKNVDQSIPRISDDQKTTPLDFLFNPITLKPKKNKKELIKILKNENLDPNALYKSNSINYLILLEKENKNKLEKEVIETLINNPKLNINGYFKLHTGLETVDLKDRVIEYYETTNLLSYMTKENQINTIKLLLNRGANPNIYTTYEQPERKARKETALHKAAINKNEKIMNLLLKNNANPYLKNEEGKTSIQIFPEYWVKKLSYDLLALSCAL